MNQYKDAIQVRNLYLRSFTKYCPNAKNQLQKRFLPKNQTRLNSNHTSAFCFSPTPVPIKSSKGTPWQNLILCLHCLAENIPPAGAYARFLPCALHWISYNCWFYVLFWYFLSLLCHSFLKKHTILLSIEFVGVIYTIYTLCVWIVISVLIYFTEKNIKTLGKFTNGES